MTTVRGLKSEDNILLWNTFFYQKQRDFQVCSIMLNINPTIRLNIYMHKGQVLTTILLPTDRE